MGFMVLESSNHVLRCKMEIGIEEGRNEDEESRKHRNHVLKFLKDCFENCYRTLLLTSHWPEMSYSYTYVQRG